MSWTSWTVWRRWSASTSRWGGTWNGWRPTLLNIVPDIHVSIDIYIYVFIYRYVDFFNFVSIVYMCIEISIHRYIHIIYIYINKLLAIPRRARSQQLSHRSSSSCGGSGTFTATRTAQGFSLKNGRTYYPLVNQHSEVKNTKFNRFFFAINVPFSRATLNYQRVDIH